VVKTEGTRSDHAKRCQEAVPGVVEDARKAGYDITQQAVRDVLRSLATAVGSIEGTQLGSTQAHYSGMLSM
jgi:hypothetical protein